MTDDQKNRRSAQRRGGISAAWATIALEDRREIRCGIMDETRDGGVGLETRDPISPCPFEVGSTYWMLLKPSSARKASWVAGTVRNIREKGVGSGIFRMGITIETSPPEYLGVVPSL